MGPFLWAAVFASSALAGATAPVEAGDDEIIENLDFFMNMEVAESYDLLDLVEADEPDSASGAAGGDDDAKD